MYLRRQGNVRSKITALLQLMRFDERQQTMFEAFKRKTWWRYGCTPHGRYLSSSARCCNKIVCALLRRISFWWRCFCSLQLRITSNKAVISAITPNNESTTANASAGVISNPISSNFFSLRCVSRWLTSDAFPRTRWNNVLKWANNKSIQFQSALVTNEDLLACS